MTPEEFAAAGEQGKRAADAAASLRDLPGFVGISVKDGKIVVEGSGPELQARIAELNNQGPDEIVLVDPPAPSKPADPETSPATDPPSDPQPSPSPSSSPQQAPDAAAQAAPQQADSALMAASIDQLYHAYVREVGTSGLQAVAYSDGQFVIRTGGSNSPESSPLAPVPSGPASGEPAAGDTPGETDSGQNPSGEAKMTPSEFVAKYANVKLEKGEPIAAEEDFFGGQGYYIDKTTVCSAGFSAFNPGGQPLVLTAGHCSNDGAAHLAEVALSAGEPAGGATEPPAVTGKLGTFGFSQFGGPGNSTIAGDPSNVGTDIAVLESIRPDLNVLPEATTWGSDITGGNPVQIVGAGEPLLGQAVCKSGRTSGWTCGRVDEVAIYVVGGHNNFPDGADLRAFKGFASNAVKSGPGDSGGPWISGHFAVGLHTGAESGNQGQLRAIATTLNDAMTRLPGVQLEVFLNKPVLTSPADGGAVPGGGSITGKVDAAPASSLAANSKVRISVPGHDPFEVPVGSDGNWRFAAPAIVGELSFTAETVNGFSSSGTASLSVVVDSGVLPAPLIDSPAENAVLTSLEEIRGSGTPGATVELSGAVVGSARVSWTGQWVFPVESKPGFGPAAVTATQTATGMQDSPVVTRNFTLVPPAPTVTNVQDGQHFAWDGVPPELTGTGLDGALVSVELDGVKLESVLAGKPNVDNQNSQAAAMGGVWSVSLPANIVAGGHTLAVTQSMEGVASAKAALTFIVDPKPSVTAVLPAASSDTAGSGSAGSNMPTSNGWLALTGAGGIWLLTGIGGSVLLLGSIALFAARRRRSRR